MARQDQSRERTGQFGTAEGATRGMGNGSDEPLNNVVSTKVTSSELRMFTIIFDHHRKQFGWQTMSDMYRSMLSRGYVEKHKLIKNPTPEMLSMVEQAEEMERIEYGALKHKRLDHLLSKVHEDIETALQAGDLMEVRRQLAEFKTKTEGQKDAAVKQRRRMEWDTRYARLWDGLNRSMSLDPTTYVLGDDE